MSQPQTPMAVAPGDGMLAQILLKQGEMGEKLAVINTKLDDLPDHEQRIRVLESARAKLIGACLVISGLAGGGAGWLALALSRR